MFWTRNITVYLVSRIVAGLFDTVQYLSQAVIADITTNRDRAKYLAQLESVVNVSQMMARSLEECCPALTSTFLCSVESHR